MSNRSIEKQAKNKTKINNRYLNRIKQKVSINTILFGIALVLPFVLLTLLVRKYAINVPFYDQWELVDLFRKGNEGTLGLADFFAQHNEHRLLFPRIVMYNLGKLTNWNVNYELGVSLVLALLSFVMLLQLIRSTLNSRKLFMVSAVIVSFIFFSPLQWENWLWGWQIQWYMNVLGVIGSVWALTAWNSTPRNKLITAALFATFATYSLGSGMFAWIICLPLIYFGNFKTKYLIWWIGFMLIVIGSHYIGYVNPSYHPSKTLFLHQPIQFIHYFVVYIVRPINYDYLLSKIYGAFLLSVALAIGVNAVIRLRKNITGAMLPWIAFAAYGLMSAASTAMSRLGFGVEQGYANRYVTLANFFLIAIVILLFITFEITKHTTKYDKVLRGAALISLAIISQLVLLNYGKGIQQMQQHNTHLMKVRSCAISAKSKDDQCLLLLYPDKTVVWERLVYLRSIHYGGL